MSIVAHQDDDLLFMNPAIQQAIDAGDCVRTVYLTAGDAGMGASYWQGREAGSEAAYLQMLAYAGFDTTADTEQQQTLTVTDATGATHHVFAVSPTGDPNVTQIFLRLPDGFPGGTGSAMYGNASLTNLWVAFNDANAANVAGSTTSQPVDNSVDGANSYTEAGLVSTLDQLMANYQPTVIKVQDNRLLPFHDASGNLTGAAGGGFCAGPAGPPDTAGPIVSLASCSAFTGATIDHADHIAGAHFAQWASDQFTTSHFLVSFEGGPLSARPPGYDLVAAADVTLLAQRKYGTFLAYLPHDPVLLSGIASCGSPGGTCLTHDTVVKWLENEHIVGVKSSP